MKVQIDLFKRKRTHVSELQSKASDVSDCDTVNPNKAYRILCTVDWALLYNRKLKRDLSVKAFQSFHDMALYQCNISYFQLTVS